MSAHFDPHSYDSMFTKVLNRQEQLEKILKEILAEVKKTNGRVTLLEQLVAVLRGQKALVISIIFAAAGVAGWATHIILTIRR